MELILEFLSSVVAFLSIVLISFLLFVMCKTKSIRESSANSFTFAILIFDLISAAWFAGYNYVVRSSASTRN